MKPLLFATILLFADHAVSLGQAPATGSIVGTIRYVGDVPPSQRVMTTDGQVILHNDIVVHPKTKGLRDVVIVLDWHEATTADAKARPVVIDQRDMVFLPRVVAVQEGRAVRFENNDLCNHAVSAQSILAQNAFNTTTPPNQAYEHKFKGQKNPIPIGCPIHAWMRAWVMVTPHPYHAVTNGDGTFRIEQVPIGKHRLLLLHPDTSFREQIAIEVRSGMATDISREWKKLK